MCSGEISCERNMSGDRELEADDGLAGPSRRSRLTPVRIGCMAMVLVAVVLAVTNPSDAEVRQQILADGWAPVRADRTDLRLLSYTRIVGFTGAKATYVGIGGRVFGFERGQ
jgi:hypothetical protein